MECYRFFMENNAGTIGMILNAYGIWADLTPVDTGDSWFCWDLMGF